MVTGRHGLAIVVACAGLWAACTSARAQEIFPTPPMDGSVFRGGESRPSESVGEAGTASPSVERDEIETDRDSFTPATTITPVGRAIIESAYTFLDNRRTLDTHSFPEVVVRYGVADWLELRLQWNFEIGGAGDLVSSGAGDEEFFDAGGVESEGEFGYGFKMKITEQQGWIPESSFLALGFIPTSGRDQNASFVGTYVWGWTLPRRWKLDAAIRYSTETNVEDGASLWAPSIVLKVPVRERVNVHAEYFGIFSTGQADNTSSQYFSPGLHFLLTNDCEVGFRLGWGFTADSAKFFVNVGLGLRF